MNRNLFTRIFLMSALCIAVVTGSVFVLGRKPVLAETKVVVDSTNFPDDAFRNYVLQSYDSNLPYGILDEQEFENATSIWIMGDKNLKSLKGIELLTNVHTISVNDCNISSVNLSHNTNIESLYLENTNLKSLNVKPLSKLRDLFVTGNGITSLDLSGNPNIGRLGVSNTKISSIDISGLSNLTEFRCEDCTSLKTLDVSHNSKLSILCCNRCNLKTIKFGSHPDLFTLSCGQNELTSLDVSSFSKLQDLYFSDNKISTFKMGNHPELLSLFFDNNKVNKIDVSSCSKLQRLLFRNNLITTVNVNNCPELTEFDARGNPLKSLSIDKCYNLKSLDCVDTELNSLVCPPSETLYSLLAYPSKITKINISGCKLLVDAYKKGIRNDYIDYIGYDISNGSDFGYFTYGKNVKIITNGTIEPTDTPTPTPTPVADISDNTSEITVDAGVKVRIDASVLGSKPYNWSSSDKTIATVDSNGYVTGKKAGTCTITVTKGTKKLICKVTVTGTVAPTAKPTSKPSGGAALTLDKKSISLVCGKTDSLKATLKGASGKITWKSSDTKIATVDANGKITTKQAGAVTITATAAGKSASCMVTVLYKDVTSTKDFWYAPTNYLTAKGVVKGYDKQTKFKPANDCTRAQMLTFMWRLQSEPAPKSSTCKFPDVKKTDYFYKPVIWAVEQGITTGYKDGTFKPQNVCTRAQTVTFLWRMAKTPKAGSSKNPFKDVKKSDYFYNAVLWASGKKIVAGYSDGIFKPQGKCLRRQMVTFLYKYDKFVNGKG